MQDLWGLKELIKLNVNKDMNIITTKRLQLNANIVSAILNTQTLRII